MKKILLVEDMQEINDMLKHCLEKDGYECTQAFSGSEAKLLLSMQQFDIMLLDLMLPGVSGNQLLLETRAQTSMPIIVISAKDELDTRIEVLELGADDFICKPFELKEVVARVHVQLRKSGQALTSTICVKDIELHPDTYQVFIHHKEISLTKVEFQILKLLMESPKQVFTKQNIYEQVWGNDYLGDEKTVNTHIGNLRSKLRVCSEQEYIQTVWGIGFTFAAD